MATKSIVALGKDTFNEWSKDNAMRLAAALACYTILSLAPLVVITMKVVTMTMREEAATGQVQRQLGQLTGPQVAEGIGEIIKSQKSQDSGFIAATVSFVILLFSASGVFGELQNSMNTIWEVKPKPNLGWVDWAKKRFFSMSMVFGIIFLLLTSMFITAALNGILNKTVGGAHSPDATTFAKTVAFIADFIVTTGVIWGLFMLIFKYLPDVKIAWRHVWLGALVTALLFKVGQYALAFYFAKGTTTSAYGAAGSLVAVLLWAYYSAAILFFGAEFTKVYTESTGERIEPDEDSVAVTEEARAQQGIPKKEDVALAAKGVDAGAAKRGALYPREAVPERRVVTITRPTVESQKAYALAGLGLAAGFAVGAIGMLKGRKYTSGGIRQIELDQRLAELESRMQGRKPELVGTAIRVEQRLADLDARLSGAHTALQRRRTEAARNAAAAARAAAGEKPSVKERFDAAVKARRGEPNIIERLTGVSTKPTFWERLSEMVGKS